MSLRLHRPAGAKRAEQVLPVVEVFGPTIQGEGPEAGLPCSFIRFGGCDYRCSWCDSPHAVDPEQVKQHATWTTVAELLDQVPPAPRVILSGGNPALLQLGPLLRALRSRGMTSSVETQGSRWRPWLAEVDQLVVSPKPPSSGMVTLDHAIETATFFDQVYLAQIEHMTAIKVVVFDEDDYLWASDLHERHPRLSFFVSAGTPQPTWDHDEPPAPGVMADAEDSAFTMMRDNYRVLCERVARDPAMANVRALPQLHVVAWGMARGV